MNKEVKTKIYNTLKEKNLSLYGLEKSLNYSNGTLYKMIEGERPFPKTIMKKLLPVLEISKNEFESWIITDKYPKNIIKKAVEAVKNRENKKARVFTQNIDKILQEKNMSRTALAKSIKYNQAGINAMIIGKISVSKTVLTRFSKFLEIPEEDLQAWVLADKYSLKVLELALKKPA
jgi:predicted transcriptional regulator